MEHIPPNKPLRSGEVVPTGIPSGRKVKPTRWRAGVAVSVLDPITDRRGIAVVDVFSVADNTITVVACDVSLSEENANEVS